MSYWKRFVEWCQEPSKIKIRTFNPRNVMVLATISIILASSITFGAWRYYFPAEAITLPPDIQEHALVQLTGDIITRNGTTIHYINRSSDCCMPRCVFVHSDWGGHLPFMHVETTPGLWSTNDTHHLPYDFTGDQEGKIQFHIDRMGARAGMHENTWVIYRFGEYTQEDVDKGTIIDRYVGWRKYKLEGQGQWAGERIPYGTITVDDKAFKISQMFFTPVSAGKWAGGTYVTFYEVWTGRLSFTVTIDPLE